MKTPTTWLRCRFHTDEHDPRPFVFPPPGPWWCSGVGDNYSIVIAYVRTMAELKRYWPDYTHLEAEEVDEIVYTDRFPKPDWYKP